MTRKKFSPKVNFAKRFQRKAFRRLIDSKQKNYTNSFFTTFVRPLNRDVQIHYGKQRLVAKEQFKKYLDLCSLHKELAREFTSFRKPLRKLMPFLYNSSPFRYLLLFLKKGYLRQETQKAAWKGRLLAGKQLRRFGQITLDRTLPRLHQRIIKLPVFRLPFFYIFDNVVLWIYFFFRKIGRLLQLFFYEQWCNLYFYVSAKTNNTFLFVNKDNFKFLYSKWLSNYFETRQFAYKILVSGALFSGLSISSFTNAFKLMCLFWNKRKHKHIVFRLSSSRWKKKFASLKTLGKIKKQGSLGNKMKTTGFFFSSKILRFKFRSQHGHKVLTDYPLRVQLRKLKAKTRPKPGKTYCLSRPRTALTPSSLVPPGGLESKLLKPKKAYYFNHYARLFLHNRRRIFIRDFLAPLVAKSGVSMNNHNKHLRRREVFFLKRFCKKWFEFSPAFFIKTLLNYIKHLQLKSYLVPANKSWLSLKQLMPVFYGDKVWAAILIVALKYLIGTKKPTSLNLPLDKYNKIKSAFVLKQKLAQRQGLVNLSFAQLYEHFANHDLQGRRFFEVKHGVKNRKLGAGLKRRKLLLAIKFKTFLPQVQRAPLFCFSLPQKTTPGL